MSIDSRTWSSLDLETQNLLHKVNGMKAFFSRDSSEWEALDKVVKKLAYAVSNDYASLYGMLCEAINYAGFVQELDPSGEFMNLVPLPPITD